MEVTSIVIGTIATLFASGLVASTTYVYPDKAACLSSVEQMVAEFNLPEYEGQTVGNCVEYTSTPRVEE